MNRRNSVLNIVRALGLAFIALFSSQGSGQAQGISVGKDVNISERAADYLAPPSSPRPLIATATEVIMEVNPLNPKHLVAMANSGHFLYYSLDGGMNWQHITMEDVGVFTQPGVFHTDPSLTFDDQGTLYAATGSLALQQAAICRFENSVFASNPVRPSYCTTIRARDKWHIGAGPAPGNPAAQNVYLAESGFSGIEVSYSTDGGRTFTASQTRPLGFGTFPRPVVARNGNVYVAWIAWGGNIMVARSTNGGQNFDPAVLVANTPDIFMTRVPAQPARGIFTGPVIDVDRSGGPYDGRLYVAYVDEGRSGGNDYDIFVVRSENGGQNWTLPVRINDDPGAATQFLPWLDVDQKTGTVVVVWYDTRNDPTNNVKVRTYLATSVDGGRTFGPNIPVADAESDESDNGTYVTSGADYAEYIGVAVDGGVAHVVWSDNHMTHASAAGWFRKNPAPGSTLTLNGATWTFVSGQAVGNQTQIQANKSDTVKRLVDDLNASPDPEIQEADYFVSDDEVLIIQAKVAGAVGGNFTLAATYPAGCVPDVCFVNFVDQNIQRLIISLNLKTDQVPVPSTPGEQMIVVSKLDFPSGAGRILHYDGKSGAFVNEFIPNCASVNPQGNCAAVPGAAENPVDMVFGPDLRLYVADTAIGGTSTIPSGLAVKRYNGATGLFEDQDDPYAGFIYYGAGGLVQIGGLAFGPDSNLYISDFSTGRVLRYHGQTGAFIDTYVAAGTAQTPGKVLFGPDGNLYVLDYACNCVLRFQGPFGLDPGAPFGVSPRKATGEFVTNRSGGLELDSPSAAVFAPDGRLYVASFLKNSILRYRGPFETNPGEFVDQFVPPNKGGLFGPAGLAFGPGGRLYVSSSLTRDILGFDQGLKSKAFTGTLAYVVQPGALVFSSVPAKLVSLGDFNGDGCVAQGDLTILTDAIRAKTTDKKYDLNGDGVVNKADARKLVLLFTNPRGAACP